MPQITIPTFPQELASVPNGAPWFDWREDVKTLSNITRELTEFGDDLLSAKEYQQLELSLCASDPARWIALWLYIEEPRLLKNELPIKSFVPFAFQVELAQWFAEKTAQPEAYDGFVSKSRGLGASWIFAAMATWAWLFKPWRGILISRKEDLVDKKGDLNSLFGKIDFILEHLPEWMLPEGYDPNRHRMKNFLNHPTGYAAIVGEATTAKSTRGGRATYIIYDETAFIPEFTTVFGTGSGTSNHRWCVSSESFEEGSSWWDMWHIAQERDPGCVKELNWQLNPYFDEYWYTEEKGRWEADPAGFMREYERDPFSGGTWIYPTIRTIKTFSPNHYNPNEILLVGIDPGRADDTAIVFMQFEGTDEPRLARFIDSYSNNYLTAEYYAHILTGIEPEPGDPMYNVNFDNYALNVIMPWMRQMPWSGKMRVFCDPAGGAKSITDGLSFTDRITLHSKKIRTQAQLKHPGDYKSDRLVGIVPLYEELFTTGRQHKVRHDALRKLLMNAEFADQPGAKRLKRALEEYRFSEPGSKSTSEPAPLHDIHSHLASAAEYIACYCDIGLGRVKAKRDRK